MTLFISGCFGLFDSGSDRIAGKFIVLWIDLQEKQGVHEESELHSSNSWEIVPPYVFAVGHDENYIIAKQHPLDETDFKYQVDNSITNYYIVEMVGVNSMVATTGTVRGPLDKSEFDSIRTHLDITSIEFDMLYPGKP